MRKLFFALRILAGAVFAVSGYLKLIEPAQNFLTVIQGYQILGGLAALWAARVIPWAEFIFGVFLVLGLWPRTALTALWALNSAFILALGSAIWRKLPLKDCGCFGDSLSMSLHDTLLFDMGLFLIFVLLIKLQKSTLSS